MKSIAKTRIIATLVVLLSIFNTEAATFEVDGIWYTTTSRSSVRLVPEPYASGSGASFVMRHVYEGDIVIPWKVTYNGTVYTVTSVEDGTFKESPKLTSISIPISVTDLGKTPFADCGQLSTITVAPENRMYTTVDGLLYDKTVTTLIACPGTKAGAITLPSTVTAIAKSAFQGCTSVTSVDIPQQVKNIGACAFYGCKQLTAATLPEGVTSVEDSLFYACSALTSMTLPHNIKSIGVNAFYHCNLLKSLILPDALEVIHDRAFTLCYGMTTVTAPTGLKRIGYRAFDNCSKLNEMAIPASLTLIDSLAFSGCSNLRRIDVAEANSVYRSIDGVVFDKGLTTLVCCPAGKLGNYVVPASVSAIGDYGFYYCRSLQSITLPLSLKTVGDHAFRFCSALKTIVLPPTLATLGHDAFSQCSSLKSLLCYSRDVPEVVSTTFNANNFNVPLYVPRSALDDYQNAAYWQKFATIQPISPEMIGGLMGDTNGDGEITVTDVRLTVNAIIGQDLGYFLWQRADMNYDGGISIADVTSIVSVIMGE